MVLDIPLDLSDVPPLNDGGAISLHGFKYQYHFAAYKCLEMLLNPSKIEYVACELQDDVVVKLNNGQYEFYQIKERQGDQWKISTLKSEGIWRHFLWLQKQFQGEHKYIFVSNQTSQTRVSNKHDLGKLKELTDRGREYCSELEQIIVDELVDRLTESVEGVNREEFKNIFWNIRLITGFSHFHGLIAENLIKLEEVLLSRRIDSDINGRKRIYYSILSLLERSVSENRPETTYRDKLEKRKVTDLQVSECFVAPFKDPHISTFNTSDNPEQNLTLREKSERAGFPEHFIKYFLESRNSFIIRYRQDFIHAVKYTSELRLKVWDLCIASSLGDASHIGRSYKAIRSDLEKLAKEENENFPPVIVDFHYLHGILCQLTAECDNYWEPLK